jgi:hypothetical protein
MIHKIWVLIGTVLLIFFAGTASVSYSSLNQIEGTLANSQMSLDGHHTDRVTGTTAPFPESTAMILLGVGLIGIAGTSRKRFSKK